MPWSVVLAQQRPQEVVGGTHLPCAFVGNAAVQDPSGVDPVGGLVEHIHLRPHLVQNPQTNGNITDIGYIFDDAWLVRQDHRRKDRNRRILGTADFHFSHQLASALDDKFIQTFSLLIFSPSVVPGGENRFAAGTLFFCLLNLFCSVLFQYTLPLPGYPVTGRGIPLPSCSRWLPAPWACSWNPPPHR